MLHSLFFTLLLLLLMLLVPVAAAVHKFELELLLLLDGVLARLLLLRSVVACLSPSLMNWSCLPAVHLSS